MVLPHLWGTSPVLFQLGKLQRKRTQQDRVDIQWWMMFRIGGKWSLGSWN